MSEGTRKPVKFLQGEKVYLRPVEREDIELYYASLSNEEMVRMTGLQGFFTKSMLEGYVERISGDKSRADFIFCSQETDEPLGDVVLNSIDRGNRCSNMRVAMFNQEQFGKGYGSEAIRLLLDYGFGRLNLHRVELEVYAYNERAIRAYEKLGFKREGIRRDGWFFDHKYHDCISMGILEDEYRELYKK